MEFLIEFKSTNRHNASAWCGEMIASISLFSAHFALGCCCRVFSVCCVILFRSKMKLKALKGAHSRSIDITKSNKILTNKQTDLVVLNIWMCHYTAHNAQYVHLTLAYINVDYYLCVCVCMKVTLSNGSQPILFFFHTVFPRST